MDCASLLEMGPPPMFDLPPPPMPPFMEGMLPPFMDDDSMLFSDLGEEQSPSQEYLCELCDWVNQKDGSITFEHTQDESLCNDLFGVCVTLYICYQTYVQQNETQIV